LRDDAAKTRRGKEGLNDAIALDAATHRRGTTWDSRNTRQRTEPALASFEKAEKIDRATQIRFYFEPFATRS